MRKFTLLFFVLLMILPFRGFAQTDTIPDLVISEARKDSRYFCYIELTNQGDTALDLSSFRLTWGEDPSTHRNLPLSGILGAGESILISSVEEYIDYDAYDRPVPRYMPKLAAQADILIYADEGNLGLPFDSVSINYQVLQSWNGWDGNSLWYKSSDADSMIIDAVNIARNDNGGICRGCNSENLSVAGVLEAAFSHILVRKASVIQGNLGDWDGSRGVDLGDSEWMPIPHKGYNPDGMPYRTVGNHGDFQFDVTTEHPGITVDEVNNTLTLPWGILKGDSVIVELALGDGMAWWYTENPSFEDSLHTICQAGDTMTFYACGKELLQYDLTIQVSEPANDMALVFPMRRPYDPSADEPIDNDFESLVIGGAPYYVTEEEPGMDTIGAVPFATRVDTLMKYLEKAPKASWEIVWVDDMERVDLKFGDKLKVTAEDGSTLKEYFIAVREYAASDNAYLSAITWPDMPEDLEGWAIDYDWIGDTIPGFASGVFNYNITLPFGTQNVPVLSAYTQDINSRVASDRAISLKGGIEERTTVFTVTSEVDTIMYEYKITFALEKLDIHMQEFAAEPFISEYHSRWGNRSEWFEVVNPGNVELDLSQYLIIISNQLSLVDALAEDIPFTHRYRMYVPGYKFTDDTVSWESSENKVLQIDAAIDPTLDPGDVFVIAGRKLQAMINGEQGVPVGLITEDSWDIAFPQDMNNTWGIGNFGVFWAVGNCPWPSIAYYLCKIDNDSILDGTKAIGDPLDLTLIDQFGYTDGTAFGVIGGQDYGHSKGWKFWRKPNVWHGNPSYVESAGTTPEDSEWDRLNQGLDNLTYQELFTTVGSHDLAPVTHYISTVSSLVYKVDDGYEGDLSINGVSNSETVEQFYGNLLKADTGQVLSVHSNADGSVKAVGSTVEAGDTLIVTSADAMSTTKYVLDINPLDDNATLTVDAAQADSYTISVDGAEGTVSGTGVVWGATVQDIMEALLVPDLATFNVINQDGDLVPLQRLNSDTVYAETLVSDHIFIEVTAENGINKITYQFMPLALSSDAFVVSSVYKVMEEAMIIANIYDQTSVAALMANVEAVTGASMKVIDKAGFERPSGIISYDDRLVVVSEDGTNTVNYYLTFFNEMSPDVPNQAPVAVIVADANAQKGTTISVTADVTDDGLPEGSALTYLWEVTAGDASNVTIASADQMITDVTFSDIGSYDLSLTVSDGELSITAVHSITVTPGVGFEQFDLSSIKIYPNPTRSMVNVDFGIASQVESQIRIVDMIGKVAYVGNHFNDQVRISLEGFDAGVYFMIINVDDQSLINKLSILK